MAVLVNILTTYNGAGNKKALRELAMLQKQATLAGNGVAASMFKTSASMQRAGAQMAKTGASMSKYITLPIVAVGAVSVVMAAKFEKSMKLIQTQAGGSAKDVEVLSAAVLKLATKGQHGPNELAAALYHLKSVGMDNVTAMKALTQAEKLASVGGADLEQTTNAVAGAYKSGIKGTKDFSTTVGTLNAIIGAGNLRMDDLNSAMGTGFLVNAETFGVSLTSVGAALAMMTSRGIPATRAAMALKMAFAGIAAPSKVAEKAFAKLGLESRDLAVALREKGLGGALAILKEKLAGLSKTDQAIQLTNMFGAKSSQAILTLIGNLQDYDRTQKQVAANSGKFNALAAAQSKDATAKWAHFKASMASASILIGNVLLPTAIRFADALGGIGAWLNKLSPGTRKWAVALGLVLAAAGPVLVVVGKLSTGIGALVALYGKLALAMGRVSAVKGARGLATAKYAGAARGAAGGAALAGGGVITAIASAAALAAGILVAGAALGVVVYEAKKWMDSQYQATPYTRQGQHASREASYGMPGWNVDTTGAGKAIAKLEDRLAKLQKRFAGRTALGLNTDNVVHAIALVEGKIGILRDEALKPMYVGHLNVSTWTGSIAQAKAAFSAWKHGVQMNMWVGHLLPGNWTGPIAKAKTAFLAWKFGVQADMWSGHLNTSGWTSPISKAMKAYNAWKSAVGGSISTGRLNNLPSGDYSVGGGAANVGGAGYGWASALASNFGLSVSSTYRPGAITASGNISDHGTYGRAADIAGPDSAMNRLWAYVKSTAGSWKQAIHEHQMLNYGALGSYGPSDHFDHVHLARMAFGGGVNGPLGGYPVMMHGRESVVAHDNPTRGLADLAAAGIGRGAQTLSAHIYLDGQEISSYLADLVPDGAQQAREQWRGY